MKKTKRPDQRIIAARLREVRRAALRVWKSQKDAEDFLSRPHQLLRGQTPISVAKRGAGGAQRVIAILGRLEYGISP